MNKMVWSIPYAALLFEGSIKAAGITEMPFSFRRSAQTSTAPADARGQRSEHPPLKGALSPEADELVKVDWDAYGEPGQEARRRLRSMSLEELGLK